MTFDSAGLQIARKDAAAFDVLKGGAIASTTTEPKYIRHYY